jgi:hypothetical protein
MTKHLIKSAIATAILYIAFACANQEINPLLWSISVKIIFLLCMGMCDIFVIRQAEKNTK